MRYKQFENRNLQSEIEGACSSAWLERTPDKREVDGSTPSRPTKIWILDLGIWNEKIRKLQSKIRNRIGGVAQLGERLPCTQEVIGSNPFTSTKVRKRTWLFFLKAGSCFFYRGYHYITLFFDNLFISIRKRLI